ncbi:MAG TPA: DUF4159 domain-containing protein [Gemmatimonadales bacterium]|nr:DUF4159 domain-containing protein [Gemmatimonadales bacterium]
MRRIVVVLALAVIATSLVAQRRSRNADALPNTPYDGKFTFVRIKYNPGGMGGDGGFGYGDPRWNHDYPRAEAHFGKILSELSLVPTFQGGGNVLTFDDPELFNYPIAYLTEPGFWSVNQKETEGMRAWLAKGGFLIVDDFVGNQWYNFEEKLKIVLPDARLVHLDASHPIFDSFFRIASLDFYHPYFQGAHSEFFGVFEDNDPAKRLMIIVNYNNDVAEYWEWSDTDFAPIELTNEAYKLGINYVLYAMTH